jgi:hypothetical protein
MKNRLAVISSFNPSATLLSTVAKLQEYYNEFDIVIVDSDSSDCSIYHSLPPECKVDYIKNKNYELGAWTYAFQAYPNYDIYMFIQDTLTPNCRIPDFNETTYENGTIYTFHYHPTLEAGGYFEELVDVYRDSNLHFISQLDPTMRITGGAHTSFITNKEHVHIILQLEDAYIHKNLKKTKVDSWLSERTVGIMADTLPKRINIWNYFTKTHGNRM